jgi:uncharacterized protein YndB with AHSA1/START domain
MVKQIDVAASLDDVWTAWTTAEGLRFVSEKSNVELRRGGPYEWFLDLPPDENGKRGGEGARILAFHPKQMLAFSWTFPPAVPELRNADETYQVVVYFTENDDGTVRVQLNAHEWQDGEPWDRGYEYFDRAWTAVLDHMKQSLEAP